MTGNAALAADLARALDPVELAIAAGLQPDPWQIDFLRSQDQRVLLNCSRQSGKSTMTAVLSVHVAKYEPDSLVLLLSPTLRQSQELFKKVRQVFGAVGEGEGDAESALRLELRNGSRIVSLPGNELTVRGYSGVRLLAIDEAARVPGDLYISVRPMLATSRGRLIALSTPFGTRGWWYEAWFSGEAWRRFEVPAEKCPRIDPEFLEEERRTLGEWWFNQEYGCCFVDGETQAFAREDIDRAFEEEVETWTLT